MLVEDRVHERFLADVTDHRMEIIRDDDLYRHIRFQRPQALSYYFDLVTWPGHLVITGDCGSFMFSRIRDMFEFFEKSSGINPRYWSEKLLGPNANRAVRTFSDDKFNQAVGEWLTDQTERLPDATAVDLITEVK